jgi:Protein of unknwon function (DUF3310)
MPENPVYPSHYRMRLRDGRQCEVIDIVEALDLGFNLGNALKYLARAGRKDGEPAMTALLKAEYYIAREIENRIEDATDPSRPRARSRSTKFPEAYSTNAGTSGHCTARPRGASGERCRAGQARDRRPARRRQRS